MSYPPRFPFLLWLAFLSISKSPKEKKVVIIGGGPTGLFAAYKLLEKGLTVELYDQMTAVGKKFLVAGHGGLNLTHSESLPTFTSKYGKDAARFKPWLENFSPKDLREWCQKLGVETFVGTSGRVFPQKFKAGEMLILWLKKLKENPKFKLFTKHRLQQIETNNKKFEQENNHPKATLIFESEHQKVSVPIFEKETAVLFSLGGGSWSKTGSDGFWIEAFQTLDLSVAPFKSMNSGFECNWSPHFKNKAQFKPLKNISLSFQNQTSRGELMITPYGIEGGALYPLSGILRDEIERKQKSNTETGAEVELDLYPDLNTEEIVERLSKPRGKNSLSNHLRKKIKLGPLAFSLLKDVSPKDIFKDNKLLANNLKKLPIQLFKIRPLEESISTSGGLTFNNLDDSLMISSLPGFFAAGEMLDWEAPTGGYLLQGCFSTAYHVSESIFSYFTS